MGKDKNYIKEQLLANKGYITKTGVLKKGYKYLANKYGCSLILIKEIISEIRQSNREQFDNELASFTRYKAIKPVNYNKIKTVNRLIVGDLHAPWILDGYLEWCKELESEYKCNKVMMIGDIIDSHSWSFHEHDVDGMSVGDELIAAKKQLKLAYKLFPDVEITLGNHDLLIARKARAAGLSQHFIKDLGEILESPKGWNYGHEFMHDNVKYIHGSIGNAFTRATASRVSTVQGHLHSQAFVQYSVSEKDAIFGLQIGCGLDHSKYAFEYAKPMPKKPVISAGLVLENGSIPLIRLMKL